MVENILNWYWQADETDRKEGSFWYESAFDLVTDIAYQTCDPHFKIAGIIAALSPQKSWNENKNIVNRWFFGDKKGHTKQQLDKCRRIMAADTLEEVLEILGGLKTRAFCLNILGFDQHVCIDRHAMTIAGFSGNLTPKRYAEISEAYITAAYQLEISPANLQAITWVAYRRISGVTKTYGK